MSVQSRPAVDAAPARRAVARIGCVSYLNAKPLIDGLDHEPASARDGRRIVLKFDVPSRLTADLEDGRVDVALCPVIDYYRARTPLLIVPVGGIGCDGSTLTVRLFSRCPVNRITEIHADSESRTSVVLAQVLLHELYALKPKIVAYHALDRTPHERPTEPPQTVLLIGDKVVTGSPPAAEFTDQLDLGTAWKKLTGLPFVFAVWMARRDTNLGPLPQILQTQREDNAGRIDSIVNRHATAHGWPHRLARDYLGRILRYRVGKLELDAIERFAAMAKKLGLIEGPDELELLKVWPER